MEITPPIANKLLTKNTNNRNLKDRHVKWLATQMRLGYWRWAGNLLLWSKNNVLMNSQHTLNAIIESGTTQKFMVISGLEDETMSVIDTGSSRTAGDVLTLNGFQNASIIAATVKRHMAFKAKQYSAVARGGKGGANPKRLAGDEHFLSNERVLELVKEQPRFVEVAALASEWYRQCKYVVPSFYGTMAMLFMDKHVDEGKKFLDKFASGIGLYEGDPVYLLRKRMEKEYVALKKLPGKAHLLWFIACWNKCRKGQKMTNMPRYTNTIAIPEIL
ncbi:MAG: hypothetical protein AAF364_19315 [Pseudomonadota bacterium]